MWTVPMNPLPMTAAPMSLKCPMCSSPGNDEPSRRLDGSRHNVPRRRRPVKPEAAQGSVPDGRVDTRLSHPRRTLASCTCTSSRSPTHDTSAVRGRPCWPACSSPAAVVAHSPSVVESPRSTSAEAPSCSRTPRCRAPSARPSARPARSTGTAWTCWPVSRIVVGMTAPDAAGCRGCHLHARRSRACRPPSTAGPQAAGLRRGGRRRWSGRLPTRRGAAPGGPRRPWLHQLRLAFPRGASDRQLLGRRLCHRPRGDRQVRLRARRSRGVRRRTPSEAWPTSSASSWRPGRRRAHPPPERDARRPSPSALPQATDPLPSSW